MNTTRNGDNANLRIAEPSLPPLPPSDEGAERALIGSVLNHSSPATTQVYARLAEDDRREALEEHGQALLAAAESRSLGDL